MKLLIKTAALGASVSLFSVAAHASGFVQDELYLGFNKSGASADYIINLGQPAAVGLGGTSVVDLSSSYNGTLFNSIFTSFTGVSVGSVGAKYTGGVSDELFATSLRSGGAGVASVAGSDLSGYSFTTVISQAKSAISGVTLPTSAGTGASDSGLTWTANISPTFTSGSFYGATGINPSSSIDGSGVIYEDLWKGVKGQAMTYQGYFALDANTGSLTFTPSGLVVVPEPSTYALFGLGLLGFFFRRQIKLQNA